jgi:hypothetical protein
LVTIIVHSLTHSHGGVARQSPVSINRLSLAGKARMAAPALKNNGSGNE